MTQRGEVSDAAKSALDVGSTATRGSSSVSESLEDSDTEEFSQSETVGIKEDTLDQADRAEPRRGTRARKDSHFLGEVRTQIAVTEDGHVETQTVKISRLCDAPVVKYRARYVARVIRKNWKGYFF